MRLLKQVGKVVAIALLAFLVACIIAIAIAVVFVVSDVGWTFGIVAASFGIGTILALVAVILLALPDTPIRAWLIVVLTIVLVPACLGPLWISISDADKVPYDIRAWGDAVEARVRECLNPSDPILLVNPEVLYFNPGELEEVLAVVTNGPMAAKWTTQVTYELDENWIETWPSYGIASPQTSSVTIAAIKNLARCGIQEATLRFMVDGEVGASIRVVLKKVPIPVVDVPSLTIDCKDPPSSVEIAISNHGDAVLSWSGGFVFEPISQLQQPWEYLLKPHVIASSSDDQEDPIRIEISDPCYLIAPHPEEHRVDILIPVGCDCYAVPPFPDQTFSLTVRKPLADLALFPPDGLNFLIEISDDGETKRIFSKNVEILNIGAGHTPVKIDGEETSTCVGVEKNEPYLSPGESMFPEIHLNWTLREPGPQTASVVVRYNSTDTLTIPVSFTVPAPNLEVDVQNVVLTSKEPSKCLYLRNNGGGTLEWIIFQANCDPGMLPARAEDLLEDDWVPMASIDDGNEDSMLKGGWRCKISSSHSETKCLDSTPIMVSYQSLNKPIQQQHTYLRLQNTLDSSDVAYVTVTLDESIRYEVEHPPEDSPIE